MAEPTLRLPVAGFEQVSKILRAYYSAAKGQAGAPVSLDDVAHRAAMNRTIVSGNNAFLSSLDLIEGGNAKQLTDLGVKAALTLDHPESPEAYQAWRAVVDASPHLERVVDAVRIRRGMDEDALLSHIVLTAGVPKTTKSLTGARTIVDILEFAGVVEETDGTFRLRSPEVIEEAGTVTGRGTLSGSGVVARPPGSQPVAAPPRAERDQRVSVNVHVWVNAENADFDTLSEELKKLLSKLADR